MTEYEGHLSSLPDKEVIEQHRVARYEKASWTLAETELAQQIALRGLADYIIPEVLESGTSN